MATCVVQVAEDRVTSSVRFLIGAAVVAILLSLTLGTLVAMPLAARLGQLRDGAVKIGQGDLEARINQITSGDEIGQLAAAFNEMADRLQHSRAEIKESESNFRELAETVREVFWVCDPAGTKVHYISPAYVEVWGRSCESLYKDGRSFAEAILPEDRARVLGALEKLASSTFDEDYRITRPDGTMRWIHARAFAVNNETGQVQRVVGIATDVTKHAHGGRCLAPCSRRIGKSC